MALTLENAHLQLELDLAASTWSLRPSGSGYPAIRAAGTRFHYNQPGWRRHSLETWAKAEAGPVQPSPSPHGLLRQVQVRFEGRQPGVHFCLTFALPEDHPLLLMRLEIENRSARPLYPDILELLHASGPEGLDFGNPSRESLAFFANGWQSWSYAGAYHPRQRFQRTRLGPLRAPTDFNAGTPQPTRRGHFASDMFGVLGDRQGRSALLAGFLSQKQHFGSLEARLDLPHPTLRMWANGDRARLDPGMQISTDWACLHFLNPDDPDPLSPYLEAVRREHALEGAGRGISAQPIPTGWCSWYQYSAETYIGEITDLDIRHNLHAMASARPQLPLQICQIDDGFQSYQGDWFIFSPGFPDGIEPLAADIRQADFTPGLWLAPFIVHPYSQLTARHPDWLLRGRLNQPVNAGYFWGVFNSALDLTHPQALEYTQEVVHTAVHRWGYPYLKLDFLYAAALPGRYRDASRTRAQVLRAGLQALRQAAGPGAYLLGCSCPLGPAVGLVDAMRIGTDVGSRWYTSFGGVEPLLRGEPNLPSIAKALHNAITRAPLHHRWWVNDPDCLLLGASSRLTSDEVLSAATTIALSGGSLLLSDDLSRLPPEKRWIAEVLLPLTGLAPRVLDWFDAANPSRLRLDLDNGTGRWSLLALLNWEDSPRDMALRLEDFDLHPADSPSGSFWARRFWQPQAAPRVESLLAPQSLPLGAMPAHSVALFAVRPRLDGAPQYLGSDLHISQGLEVAHWDWQEGATGTLRLRLERPGRAAGRIFLSLPAAPAQAHLNETPLSWQACGEGCYVFDVQFDQAAQVDLTLQ